MLHLYDHAFHDKKFDNSSACHDQAFATQQRCPDFQRFRLQESTDMDIDSAHIAIRVAATALPVLRDLKARRRSRYLKAWSKMIVDNQHDLACLVVEGHGMLQSAAISEIRGIASILQAISGRVPKVDVDASVPAALGHATFNYNDPIGVCGIICTADCSMLNTMGMLGIAFAAACSAVVLLSNDQSCAVAAVTQLGYRAGIPPGSIRLLASGKRFAAIENAIRSTANVKKTIIPSSHFVIGRSKCQRRSHLHRVPVRDMLSVSSANSKSALEGQALCHDHRASDCDIGMSNQAKVMTIDEVVESLLIKKSIALGL